MAEPAAKKQKTEGEGAEDGKAAVNAPASEAADAGGAAAAAAAPEAPREPEAPKELEEDSPPAGPAPKIKVPVAFEVRDTSMNVLPSTFGNILMALSDSGFQYLLAGARANVGVSSGRYMFEIKVLECVSPAQDPSARGRVALPANLVRVGFSTASSSLFLGETSDSVGFDGDGSFIVDKLKKPLGIKFSRNSVVAVVLNRDKNSPNSNTISLFINGVRACQPQTLPDTFTGQTLYPTVTYKNTSLHYNFGPAPIMPLPFTCRMVQDAASKDSAVATYPAPKDGKYEVVFPVCLPEEGGFDWLDAFLAKHLQFTELSDRAIVRWAEASGFPKPKTVSVRTSNDKPEVVYGIPQLDEMSVRTLLQTITPMQQRHYVVMEMKANLLKADRQGLVERYSSPSFKKVAAVLVGEPPADFKKYSQQTLLKQKQEESDAIFRAKQDEAKRKKLLEKRQKELEKARRKAEKARIKQMEAVKRKIEEEKKKREAAAAAAAAGDEQSNGEAAKDDENKEEKEAEAEEEKKDSDEEEEAEETPQEMDEDPPNVELTAEEKSLWYRKLSAPDLTQYVLNTSFTKFSVPDKEEGFDEIRYEWQKAAKSAEYVKQWASDRKLTTRVEDLVPGEWFNAKLREWQKTLQLWHAKQNEFKAAVAKRAADKAARIAERERKKLAKAAAEATAKAAKEKAAKEAGEDGKQEVEAEEKKEEDDASMHEDEPDEKENEKAGVEFDKIDVFGVNDVLNAAANNEPLLSCFGFEDWSMMSLRYELHLLTHAFRKDVSDPDRIGIVVEHVVFYYNKYFKKALTPQSFGSSDTKALLGLIRDTVAVNPANQVVEPLLPNDMESVGVFVMLTEEARRDRLRRVDLGDESAKLKLQGGPQPGPGMLGGIRPNLIPGGARPLLQSAAAQAAVASLRPAMQPAQPQWQQAPRPAQMFGGGAAGWQPRPAQAWQARPLQQQWRGQQQQWR